MPLHGPTKKDPAFTAWSKSNDNAYPQPQAFDDLGKRNSMQNWCMSPSLEASKNYSWPCQSRSESLEMQVVDNCLIESVTNGKCVSRVV